MDFYRIYTIVPVLLTLYMMYLKVTTVKYRREHLAVRLLNIKNLSATAKVCLLWDNAEMNFEVNDCVKRVACTGKLQ